MWKVGLGLAVTAMVLGGAPHARAEEPATAPDVAPPTAPGLAPVTAPSPVSATDPCPPVIDAVAEQRAFEREMQLFARRWEVTQRLVAEREARAFADVQARYAKFADLTRKLADEAAAEAERQFDAAVALFVRKRELTAALSSTKRASAPAPVVPAVAPTVVPAR